MATTEKINNGYFFTARSCEQLNVEIFEEKPEEKKVLENYQTTVDLEAWESCDKENSAIKGNAIAWVNLSSSSAVNTYNAKMRNMQLMSAYRC